MTVEEMAAAIGKPVELVKKIEKTNRINYSLYVRMLEALINHEPL